jgi:hypothetical protein
MNDAIIARLDELRTLKDGWFYGGGRAPGDAFLDWLQGTLAVEYPDGMDVCEIVPIDNGGLRLNWRGQAGMVAADIYCPLKIARVYGVSRLDPYRVAVMGEHMVASGWLRVFALADRFCHFGRA